MAGWFPELAGLGRAIGERAAVLDREVVAVDADGRPSFGALQQRMAGRGGRRRGAAVTFLVFDLLWLDGLLLTGLPYAERRRRLEDLEVAGPAWQTVASFAGAGTALLTATREQGLEGVVAKRLQHLPPRPADPQLAQDHALPARDVPGRRVRPRPRPGQVPARRPPRPGTAGRAGVLWPGRPRPGAGGPAPVFVRPELAVEVSFLGWESGRLRHPAYAGLTRIL